MMPVALAGSSNAEKVRVTGCFSDMRYVEEVGDVVGMGVFILHSTDGVSGDYWVVFQIAEGSPAPPVLVKATGSGEELSFTLPASAGVLGIFKGTVSGVALVGKFSGMQETIRLPRGKGSCQ